MQDNGSEQAARRRRVQFIKKSIILTLLISILVPIILCMILFWKVHVLERDLKQVSGQLAEVIRLLEEQSQYTQEQEEQLQYTQEQGAAVRIPEANAHREEGPVWEDIGNSPLLSVSSGDNLGEEEILHKVYLTFDDGPSIYTDDILDILDRYEVKATFFVLGKEDEYSKEALQEIVERGHALGMHSYSHMYGDIYRSLEDFAEDFHKIQDYLYDITGIRSMIYRFPGGSSNTISKVDIREFAEYLDSQNVEYYDWNISSGDGNSGQLDVRTIVNNSTSNLTKFQTSIILLHDAASKRTTVEALPIIIESILAMENTVILPITEDTEPIQHIHIN